MFLTTSIAARLAPYRLVAEILAIVIVAGLAYTKGGRDKFNELSAVWAEQQLTQARNFSGQLQAQREDLERMRLAEREKDVTYESRMRALSGERDRALYGLRNRASRDAGVPEACAADASQARATGAELFREDGEFLVREAARADELRAALERCQGGDLARDGGRLDH